MSNFTVIYALSCIWEFSIFPISKVTFEICTAEFCQNYKIFDNFDIGKKRFAIHIKIIENFQILDNTPVILLKIKGTRGGKSSRPEVVAAILNYCGNCSVKIKTYCHYLRST